MPSSEQRTRPLTLDDLPDVAELFGAVFRNGIPLQKTKVIEHMRAIYLDGPWFDAEISSIVHTDAGGRVNGFFGVMQVPMVWRGAPVRVGITGALMVANPAADPLAAVRMAKAHLAGPQDLTICDSANRTSLDLAQELKFAIIGSNCLEWYRVLRPAGLGMELLRLRGMAGLAALGGMAARLVDHRLRQMRFRGAETAASVLDRDIEIQAFVKNALQLANPFLLRPRWDPPGLEWQLRLAAEKKVWGPLHIREVTTKAGKLVGTYLYHGRRGGVAVVLQVLAHPGMAARVLACLCRHAGEIGCVAVRGQTSAALMDGLFRTPSVFYRHRAATVAYSRDAEMVTALMTGNALVGGLIGDTWTQLASEIFD
jgi:hypothetical protein